MSKTLLLTSLGGLAVIAIGALSWYGYHDNLSSSVIGTPPCTTERDAAHAANLVLEQAQRLVLETTKAVQAKDADKRIQQINLQIAEINTRIAPIQAKKTAILVKFKKDTKFDTPALLKDAIKKLDPKKQASQIKTLTNLYTKFGKKAEGDIATQDRIIAAHQSGLPPLQAELLELEALKKSLTDSQEALTGAEATNKEAQVALSLCVSKIVTTGESTGSGTGTGGNEEGNGTGNGDGAENNTMDICGDSIVGATEECDNGDQNGGNNACMSDCKINWNSVSICGDGRIEPPYEECDDENVNDFDGCTNDCKIRPTTPMDTSLCGNLRIDESEECDEDSEDCSGCRRRCPEGQESVPGKGCMIPCQIDQTYLVYKSRIDTPTKICSSGVKPGGNPILMPIKDKCPDPEDTNQCYFAYVSRIPTCHSRICP